MLEIQKYLNKGNTLFDLYRDYHIEAKEKNGKVSFNYDQCFSPMGEKICQECRGLILRQYTWDIVACPFFKFFNYGEGFCAEIDWASAKVLEKLDGSMLQLYWDNVIKHWFFATRKMPEADGLCEIGKSYGDIAREALKVMGIDFMELQKKLNKDYTYVFEMVSPYTKVYIEYPEPKLYMLTVRDIVSLKEINAKPIAKELNFPTPKEYSFSDVKAIMFVVNTWKGTEQEGVVVVDKYFNRIKIKNKDYVAGQGLVHSLGGSNRNIIQLIMSGNEDDVMPQCPQLIKEKILKFKEIFITTVKSIEKDWEAIKHIDNQKEFAFEAKKTAWSGVLFDLKKGKITSVETYLRKNARVDYVLKLCGIDTIAKTKEIDNT